MDPKRYLCLSSTLLAAGLTLAACSPEYPQTFNNAPLPPVPASALNNGATAPAAAATGKTAGPVALLVPLTGELAPVGTALANAARLVYPGGAGLDVRDTGGNAAGAASAAQAAIAAGDGLILGPLTSAETHAVTPIAQAANVNVLAFTNDASAGAPGVWPLGITPVEQVKRVLENASGAGRTQVSALLPDTDFGHSLGTALTEETAALGEPSPGITFFEAGFSNLNGAVRDLSDFGDRGAGLEARIKAAQDLNTAAGRQTARDLQHQQIPAPAFDALFIGTFDQQELQEIATLLPFYSVNQPQVQFLGPALWGNISDALGGSGIYNGALYAAPDPASAGAFAQKYQATYNDPPPSIADVAFDAAAIAHLIAGEGGYTSALLTDPNGFTGTDGVVQLQADGQVQRGLAVFERAPGGATIVSPAPATLASPSS